MATSAFSSFTFMLQGALAAQHPSPLLSLDVLFLLETFIDMLYIWIGEQYKWKMPILLSLWLSDYGIDPNVWSIYSTSSHYGFEGNIIHFKNELHFELFCKMITKTQPGGADKIDHLLKSYMVLRRALLMGCRKNTLQTEADVCRWLQHQSS